METTVACKYCNETFTVKRVYGNYPQNCSKPACIEAAQKHHIEMNRIWHNKFRAEKKEEKERQEILRNPDLRLEFFRWRDTTRGHMSESGSALSLLASMEVQSDIDRQMIIVTVGGKEFEITPAGALAVGNDLVARARRMMPKKQKGYDDESQMSKM